MPITVFPGTLYESTGKLWFYSQLDPDVALSPLPTVEVRLEKSLTYGGIYDATTGERA